MYTVLRKFSSLNPLYIARNVGNVCSGFSFLNIHRNAVYKAKIILMSLKVNIWHHYL